jgi:NADPH2 dehydrogenase
MLRYQLIEVGVIMAYLSKPLEASSLKLANRLVMAPMATAKAQEDGKVSQELLDYYAEKSEGGYIGLVIIEHSFVRAEGKSGKRQLSVAEDNMVEGLSKLAKVIQRNGSKGALQINHAGSAATKEITGKIPVAPSVAIQRGKDNMLHELTRQEIKEIVQAFGEAAGRAKQAGFDGVEIHSAHGYLLNQFFSPLTNKRFDAYGGDLIDRLRIHLEIIEEIHNTAGKDFPVLLRLGVVDFTEGGTTIEDSLLAAREFEKAGVAILDISRGFLGYNMSGLTGQGYLAPFTEAIKKAVSIPVILTGGIREAQAAEKLLAQDKADLIGVGRAILYDSQWARKAIQSLSDSGE